MPTINTPWPIPAPPEHRALGLICYQDACHYGQDPVGLSTSRTKVVVDLRWRTVGTATPTSRGLVDWLCAHGWETIPTNVADADTFPTSKLLTAPAASAA